MLIMKRSHNKTKRNFRSDKFTIAGCTQRSATADFLFRGAYIPVGHIITDGPLFIFVHKPGIFSFFDQGGQITLARNVDTFQPQGSRSAFAVGNDQRIAISSFEFNLGYCSSFAGFFCVYCFAVQGGYRITAIFISGMKLKGSGHGHFNPGFRDNCMVAINARQFFRNSSKRDSRRFFRFHF